MARDANEEIKQLKRDYFDLEEIHQDEVQSLCRVINTFGTVVATRSDIGEDARAIKEMVRSDDGLPLDLIENALSKLKGKIMEKEDETNPDEEVLEKFHRIEAHLLEACSGIQKIMTALVKNFYPLTSELEAESKAIRIEPKKDAVQIELKKPIKALLKYIDGIKVKISKDFGYINKTFLVLLDEVKELEKTLAREFGGKNSIKEIEVFEMRINDEVGSIANSFNIYSTINEIKSAVTEKIKNIKKLVTLRKEQDMKKTQKTQENLVKLQKKIAKADKDARQMSKEVEHFQTAAMRDGLTGLFNRRAFDMQINESINNLSGRGAPFSLVMFDVDKFKGINDTLGHVAGDKVLKKVAQCLEETFRKDDFIARYGGDEFVTLIENLSEEMARERIRNFQKNLKKRKFVSYKEGKIELTVSAGITMAMGGDTTESLLARADTAMYDLKQKRKNGPIDN